MMKESDFFFALELCAIQPPSNRHVPAAWLPIAGESTQMLRITLRETGERLYFVF